MTSSPYTQETMAACEDVLAANITENGFTAGQSHFNDVWARDALYASWGVLSSHPSWAENTLDTLQAHMRDGQVPLRVGRQNMVNVFLGLPTTQGPVYANDKNSDVALDPNSLFVITAAKLAEHKPSIKNSYTASVQKAISWLSNHREDGLLHEGSYASWDDALKKQAPSVYNNALYVAALRAATSTFGLDYSETANTVENALGSALWSGDYYDAWTGRNVCDVAGNLLAAYFNVGREEHHKQMLSFVQRVQATNEDVFLKTNYPSYHATDTYYPFYLLGMHDYHDQGPYWTWITALEHLARSRVNGDTAYMKNAARLNDWIRDHAVVPEVIDDDLSHLKRLAYESETGFSWTAGLILAGAE